VVQRALEPRESATPRPWRANAASRTTRLAPRVCDAITVRRLVIEGDWGSPRPRECGRHGDLRQSRFPRSSRSGPFRSRRAAMRLADAITQYVDLKQSMGMRFRNERRILQAFHRQVGDVSVADVSTDAVATFLSGRGPITATWLNKHRVLRGFYGHWIARGRVIDTPVPTVVPRVISTFVPHIYDDDELRRLLAAINSNQARRGCQIA